MTRRDGIFKRRVSRRLNSPRASVFLEYAIVLPLFILVMSTMVEFAAFWDAKIMANHTAWVCARIASVEAGQEYVKSPDANRLRTDGMKTATTLLMSTCAMGSMHGNVEEWGQYWYEKMIKEPLEDLEKSILENIKSKLTEKLTEAIDNVLGDNPISKLIKKVLKWVADDLLEPIFECIRKIVDDLFKKLLEWIGKLLGEKRALRQLAYAALRVKEYPDIITVTERKETSFVFQKAGDRRLDFPRVLDSSAECDKWFVKSDSPWPPNQQEQRMIDVKIRWPFERAWMFPVLSVQKLSDDDSKSLEGVPTAVGRAMAYPQPTISNANLKSEGATPYDVGNTNSLPDVVSEIMAKYKGFLCVAALYYHYQMKNEEVGPYDSKKGGSGTYKGIGLGVHGGPEEKKYWTQDGLVFWMDRAPSKPESQGEWRKKSPPADYYSCWKNIVETSDEECRFWFGTPFSKGSTQQSELKRLCNRKYWSKEWFHWTADVNDAGEHHWRVTHQKPANHLYGICFSSVSNNPCFIMPKVFDRGNVCSVAEEDFNARVSSGEKETVTWKNYQDVVNADTKKILGSRISVMLDVMCTPPNYSTIMKEEPDAFNRIRFACDQTNKDALEMIENCSKELDAAVGGGKGSDPGDPGEFMDFGLTDDEIMRDPTNAAKIIEKKLEELKPKVFAAIKKIDDAERKLRRFDGEFGSKFGNWWTRRRGSLADFAVTIARGVVLAGTTSPEAVQGQVSTKLRTSCQSVLDVTKELTEFTIRYKEALVNFYNAEKELGEVLNCKYAKEQPKKRSEDPDPGLPKPDPDPDRPKPSSSESGSDDDNLGDSWTHQKGGWYKDGQKEDL